MQSVAQGWLVYDITNDKAKLAFVSFCAMAPVSLLGLFTGGFADRLNRRAVLIVCQVIYSLGAFLLGYLTTTGQVRYEHIVAVALILGLTSTVEMPTRQSLLSTIVPREDLPAAVPIQAMTFNFARIAGPAIGGVLLGKIGPAACYFVNAITYAGLIYAVVAIRADLRATTRVPEPVRDLLFEGMRYTFRDPRLRALFSMEACTSIFGIFYLALMPAIARDMLSLDATGLGKAMTAIGFGAVSGLLLMLWLSDRPVKPLIVRLAMTTMAIALIGLSYTRSATVAFPLLALAGMGAIVQFNTTNTLFQLLSPERLRGRVLAMHIWAISGMAPLGIIGAGWTAREIGLPSTLLLGGIIMSVGALLGWFASPGLNNRAVEVGMARAARTS